MCLYVCVCVCVCLTIFLPQCVQEISTTDIHHVLIYLFYFTLHIQINLLFPRKILSLVTQGGTESSETYMVTSFRLLYSMTGMNWLIYKESEEEKVYYLCFKYYQNEIYVK